MLQRDIPRNFLFPRVLAQPDEDGSLVRFFDVQRAAVRARDHSERLHLNEVPPHRGGADVQECGKFLDACFFVFLQVFGNAFEAFSDIHDPSRPKQVFL